jgi:hypothetical protein
MPSARWTRIVIALSAVTWALILLLHGESLKSSWAQFFGWTASLVVLMLLAFDRWIWCWPFVRAAIRRADVRGTWKLELRSTFEPRKDEIIDAYLAIRQTFSTISATMLTDRATSVSRNADLACEGGRWVLSYQYMSQKHADAPDRAMNPSARGAAELVVATTPTTHLEGDYWTEQGTQGRIRTLGRNPKVFDTYAAAQSATFE